MQYTSAKFNDYFKNVVLRWEGKTSKSTKDKGALHCAPFAGAYHTNKGVTFCTFKLLANKFNISPVTYDRFLQLTDEEVKRFVWEFMKNVKAEQLKDSVAFAVTEAAWMSGAERAARQLQQAINNLNYRLPVKNSLTQNVINIANNINEQLLFNEFIKIREKYLYQTLGNNPKYSANVAGWRNRMEDFKKKFAPKRKFFDFFFLGSALFFLAIPKK